MLDWFSLVLPIVAPLFVFGFVLSAISWIVGYLVYVLIQLFSGKGV